MTRKAQRVRAKPEESADVVFHPSVLEWIRKCSGADFLRVPFAEASFYLDHELLQAATGHVVDLDTGQPTGEVLYVLTRKALRLAYPDGIDIRRFKCTVCGKETAGRLGNIPVWYPRKHRVDGDVCPGTKLEAEIVKRRKML